LIVKEGIIREEIKGEVLDSQNRKKQKIGGSYHVSIPMNWKRFFNTEVLEVLLVRQDNAPWHERYVMIVKRPKPRVEGEKP